MIRAIRWSAALAIAAALTTPLAAQEIRVSYDTFDRPSLRILQDYTLRADDAANQVVVIAGDARIEGHVSEDVVVILGKTTVASTAVIDGSFVVVAGTADIAEGAKVNRDLVVIGEAHVPPSFSPGGQHVVIGTAGFGEGLRSLVPWLTHGLLLARPIVPWLGWVWIVAAIFFFLNLCLNLMFDGPVRSCAATLRTTPFSAFMTGLLVLLLVGPVCVLLAVSVIGILVVPFVLCAMLAAAVVGRIGFARWLGMSLVRQEDPADRSQSVRSFLIGSALMCVTYMIPFLGFVVWILAGVFGLGAATLSFYAAYRRENPRPPKKVKPVPPDPSAPGPIDPGGSYVPPAGPDVVPVAMAIAPPSAHAEGDAYASPPLDAAASMAATLPLLAYPKAAFGERLMALTLDLVAVGIFAQLLNLDHPAAAQRLIVLLALAYHVTFWTWRATTLGGIICQLRVVRTDGKALDFPEALIRGITGIISLVIAGLGFLWILRDPERQGWHDRVAGTYVVKVPRAYPV